jgi:hypothetical protein
MRFRFTVVHDSQGTIAALVVSRPGSPPPIQLETQPGQSMTEVEGPEDLEVGLEEGGELWTNLSQTYRVDLPNNPGRLTRKSD